MYSYGVLFYEIKISMIVWVSKLGLVIA